MKIIVTQELARLDVCVGASCDWVSPMLLQRLKLTKKPNGFSRLKFEFENYPRPDVRSLILQQIRIPEIVV